MEEDMFVNEMPENMGTLLLESLWRRSIQCDGEPVQIYERCIKYGDRYLHFSFDLRFAISDDTITWHLLEKQATFQLLLEDIQDWRNHLKHHLNQEGFHQQFKPIKKIGKGNFASVYLVEKICDSKKYAVKAFSKEAAYSEENGKQCLIKQIDIMRHLSGNHNMRLCQVFQSQNSLYIIFQLLEGGQLFQKIKAKQKFKPSQIKGMVRGILQGLREMHANGIMHRDLKPQNILLRAAQGYDCVIADFGLSEFTDAEQYLFVRCGTPGYVAPEVINIKDMKAKYSSICDIFSLGLIFHLLLFGKSVFKGKTYSEVLAENRACNFNLDAPEYESVDPLVMDLLKKMLKINPEERITADQALSHPYFKQDDEEQDEALAQSMDRVDMVGQSPILISSNDKRKQVKDLKRDSCLDFKMGKDNILTGKTQTVGTVGSGKISGFGLGLLKGLKASKFVKPAQMKQN